VIRFALGRSELRGAVVRELELTKPDVVYVNGPRLLPALDVKTPVVFHAHSYLSRTYTVQLAGRALRRLNADVIGSSQFVLKPFTSFVPPHKMRVIYNGTSDLGFQEPQGPVKTVSLVGRIAPEKGQLEFVRAARMLHETGLRFRLHGAPMFADPSYLDRVRAEAPESVEFCGWSNDVAGILHETDLLAVPSPSYESTPRVILEAFSAGTPVVAFATGGIPELFRDGEEGVSVASRTPEALAEVVRAIVSDPEALSRMAVAARKRWETAYRLERFQTEVAGVIADAALRPRSTRNSRAAKKTNAAATSNTAP